MKKSLKIFLEHIMDSIHLIEEYTEGHSQYFDVDLLLTWRVVKHELPAIKKRLTELLENHQEP